MLPAFPKKLVGREQEKKSLFSAVQFHQVIYVYGNAGIGKTSLVSSVVKELSTKQKIPVFYYNIPLIQNVQEFGEIGIQLFSTFFEERMLTAFSESSSQKNYEFLRKLGTFSGIIFLDNFHNIPINNAKALLENICNTFFECNVFITSRVEFSFNQFSAMIPYILELSGLDSHSILSLAKIHHIDDNQHYMLEKMSQVSEGNPLFLQHAIIHLKKGGLLDDIVKRSQKEFFNYIYHSLNQDERLFLHFVSWFSHPVPMSAFSFLPLSDNNFQNLIRNLCEKKILYKNEQSLYSVHDVIKESISEIKDTHLNKICYSSGLSFYINLFDSRSPYIHSLSVIHHAITLEKQAQANDSFKIFLSALIDISMEFAIEVPYKYLFWRYCDLFGFNIDLAARLGSFFVEYMLFDEALSLLNDTCEGIAETYHFSTDTAFYCAFLSVYKHIHHAHVRKKYEDIILQNIQFLFEHNNSDKAMYRFATIYYMLLWEGELGTTNTIGVFYQHIVTKISKKELALNNDYQRCMFLPLVIRFGNIQYAKTIIQSVSQEWEHSISNVSQIADIYKVLWDYYRINNEHINELKLIFQMTRSKILLSDSLHKYGTLMAIVRSFCDLGRLNDAKNTIEMVQNENIRSGDTDAVLYMYLAITAAQIMLGQITLARQTLKNTASTRNPYGYITLVQLHHLLLYLEQRDIHAALKYNRYLFKHFKNDKQNHLKAFNQILLAKMVIMLKPQKGVEKLLKKIINSENLRKRFQYTAELLLVEYYISQERINDALKLLQSLIDKWIKEQQFWHQYQAEEILLKIHWKNNQIQDVTHNIKNMEYLWNILNNTIIPSKIYLYKAAYALKISKIELAKEILYENLRSVKDFGNEILYPYFLSAMIQVLKIENKDLVTLKALESEYLTITLLASPYYKSEIQQYIQLYFPIEQKTTEKFEHDNIFIELHDKQEKIIIDKNNLTIRAKDKNIIVDFKKNPKLFSCFLILADDPNLVISFEILFQKIWNMKYSPLLHKSNVYVIIQRLRDKLSSNNLNDIIITAQEGYKLNHDYQYLFVKKQYMIELNDRQKKFLDSPQKALTKEEYSKNYHVSLRTAYSDLKQLHEEKKVKVFRKGKFSYYQPV